MLKRILEDQVQASLKTDKIVIIMGARQVGKTTLMRKFELDYKQRGKRTAWVDFTDPADRTLWSRYSKEYLKKLLSDLGLIEGGVLFVDELQKFEQIGELLKLIYDYYREVKIIASGSSSFLMMERIGDSLTGRKQLFELLPLTGAEMLEMETDNYWKLEEKLALKERLRVLTEEMAVFGGYPEVWLTKEKESRASLLLEIRESVLFKDIFELGGIHKPYVLVELARLLAFQVGDLVNPHELAMNLGVSRQTVLDYIQLLERFYIVFKLAPLASNQRDEIGTKFKVYFYDNGIRNALVGDFAAWQNRQDKGKLWENLVAVSLRKRLVYERAGAQMYFWRNYEGAEVDVVIKEGEKMEAYEAKLQGKGKIPRSFFNRFEVVSAKILGLETPEVVL